MSIALECREASHYPEAAALASVYKTYFVSFYVLHKEEQVKSICLEFHSSELSQHS